MTHNKIIKYTSRIKLPKSTIFISPKYVELTPIRHVPRPDMTNTKIDIDLNDDHSATEKI